MSRARSAELLQLPQPTARDNTEYFPDHVINGTKGITSSMIIVDRDVSNTDMSSFVAVAGSYVQLSDAMVGKAISCGRVSHGHPSLASGGEVHVYNGFPLVGDPIHNIDIATRGVVILASPADAQASAVGKLNKLINEFYTLKSSREALQIAEKSSENATSVSKNVEENIGGVSSLIHANECNEKEEGERRHKRKIEKDMKKTERKAKDGKGVKGKGKKRKVNQAVDSDP
ncbi:hypothetical protein BOTCAL_0144g00120 [Botryotinia calthae]|uniref:Uncharacterized protein n=1 Tax=Botryotinia calthae TaxID=38488 RepID=A0A4Y8D5H6_9HELO|nr:hypothetical protein BOTCAL_0144g00120 [Botryotinia calthae]